MSAEDIEEKDEYANNLIKHLFSKEGPCGEGPMFMIDPKGKLADCTDLLKKNGFKIIKLEENFYKLTKTDERGKVDGTVGKDETDVG